MNNKGQSLVIFIIIMPIIVIIIGLIIDIGLMNLDKLKVRNTIKDTISYGFSHNSSEEELKDLIDKNIKYDKIEIDITDDITIYIEYKGTSIFKLVNNKFNLTIRGYKSDNKIKYKEG